jgi:hypothetical protein
LQRRVTRGQPHSREQNKHKKHSPLSPKCLFISKQFIFFALVALLCDIQTKLQCAVCTRKIFCDPPHAKSVFSSGCADERALTRIRFLHCLRRARFFLSPLCFSLDGSGGARVFSSQERQLTPSAQSHAKSALQFQINSFACYGESRMCILYALLGRQS